MGEKNESKAKHFLFFWGNIYRQLCFLGSDADCVYMVYLEASLFCFFFEKAMTGAAET